MGLLDAFRARTPEDKELLRKLKSLLGFTPRNLELYKLALRHKSAATEIKSGFKNSNERLEFLGDAILDAIIGHYLFQKFPYKDEGFLTKLRAKIVSRSHLNHLAAKIGVDSLVESSVGLEERNTSIAGDAFEALVGAVYLDRGYEAARKFLANRVIRAFIDVEELMSTISDFKSRLIEWCQKHKKSIHFDTREEENRGPEKLYSARVLIDDKSMGQGKGLSKKKAEQNASEKAWHAVGAGNGNG